MFYDVINKKPLSNKRLFCKIYTVVSTSSTTIYSVTEKLILLNFPVTEPVEVTGENSKHYFPSFFTPPCMVQMRLSLTGYHFYIASVNKISHIINIKRVLDVKKMAENNNSFYFIMVHCILFFNK